MCVWGGGGPDPMPPFLDPRMGLTLCDTFGINLLWHPEIKIAISSMLNIEDRQLYKVSAEIRNNNCFSNIL